MEQTGNRVARYWLVIFFVTKIRCTTFATKIIKNQRALLLLLRRMQYFALVSKTILIYQQCRQLDPTMKTIFLFIEYCKMQGINNT